MIQVTGEMLIGDTAVRGTAATLHAFDPARGVALKPAFGGGDADDVDRACRLAQAAFDPFRALTFETRARFLETIVSFW
jgi:NADP-dependent aldehyde dehydrogenase